MEQAGSYLSIFVSLLFHTYRENFDHGLHLSPVLYRAIKQLIVGETSRFTDNTSLCIVSLFLIAAGAISNGCRSQYERVPTHWRKDLSLSEKKIALLKIKLPSFDFKSLVLTFQKTLLWFVIFSLHKDVSPEKPDIQIDTSRDRWRVIC